MSKPYAKISHKEVNSTEMLPYTELSNQARADLVQALPLELPCSDSLDEMADADLQRLVGAYS